MSCRKIHASCHSAGQRCWCCLLQATTTSEECTTEWAPMIMVTVPSVKNRLIQFIILMKCKILRSFQGQVYILASFVVPLSDKTPILQLAKKGSCCPPHTNTAGSTMPDIAHTPPTRVVRPHESSEIPREMYLVIQDYSQRPSGRIFFFQFSLRFIILS